MDMFNSYYALPPFSGKNYDIWATKMITRLRMNDLWDIAWNGFEQPSNREAYEVMNGFEEPSNKEAYEVMFQE